MKMGIVVSYFLLPLRAHYRVRIKCNMSIRQVETNAPFLGRRLILNDLVQGLPLADE